MNKPPAVFIATPVYNGEAYLAECIESVIRQTHTNWQYVVVDNCSTDATLEIATRYARIDQRISVHRNTSFVSSIDNHNIAVRLIDAESKYCKVVSADDWLFPECVSHMVELAEANPGVGLVGSYQLSGSGRKWKVRWDEMRYPGHVVSGREICRSHLLGGPYVFGTPTSTLYRADLVRSRNPFYPHRLPHADTSVCYECLDSSDFGFVHQVLSFERVHDNSVSAGWRKLRDAESIILRNLLAYGPMYLTKEEYERRLNSVLDQYFRVLAIAFFNAERRDYWRYHRRDLEELGYRCFGSRLAKAILIKFLDLMLNPKSTIEKCLTGNREERAGEAQVSPACAEEKPGPETESLSPAAADKMSVIGYQPPRNLS